MEHIQAKTSDCVYSPELTIFASSTGPLQLEFQEFSMTSVAT